MISSGRGGARAGGARRQVRPGPCWAGALLCGALLAAGCSHDWDAYAPLPGAGPGAGGGGQGGGWGASTSSSSGTGGAGGAQGTGGAAVSAGSGGGGGAGGGGVTVEVLATVAECIDPVLPDPAYCEQRAGAGAMTIDQSDGTLANAFHAFLRFDVDPALAGQVIEQISLRLQVGPDVGNESNQTGEVWQVTPFSLADLSTAAPQKVGQAPLAPDLGAVVANQTVTWPLPADLLAGGTEVYLGLYPLTANGVDYWKSNGAVPPRLLVVHQ